MAAPLAVLAGAFATFGLGTLAHGSGFVAVYLYGLVLGDDADLPQADAVRAFGEQLASLAEIAMFVLLGVALAQVPLRGALARRRRADARPRLRRSGRLFVYPGAAPSAARAAEAVFATAGGLKGAVPILLAALPLQAGLDGSTRIFALAGLVVLASLALPGPGRRAARAAALPRLAPGGVGERREDAEPDEDAAAAPALDAPRPRARPQQAGEAARAERPDRVGDAWRSRCRRARGSPPAARRARARGRRTGGGRRGRRAPSWG